LLIDLLVILVLARNGGRLEEGLCVTGLLHAGNDMLAIGARGRLTRATQHHHATHGYIVDTSPRASARCRREGFNAMTTSSYHHTVDQFLN
jgi:hypothetical protein